MDRRTARTKANVYISNKLFPYELRPEIWSKLIKNPMNISEKWYQEYIKILEKRSTFGSRDIISRKIDDCLVEFLIDDDEGELKNKVMKNILLWELSQPDIGYVIGMEKIATFFKRICNDYEAFIVFHNSIFSSSFLWTVYSQNHSEVTHLSSLISLDGSLFRNL